MHTLEKILHRKREAFWFSERKRNKRKESRFKKEEKNKKEMKIFLFVLEQIWVFGGWYIYMQKDVEREEFLGREDRLKEKHKGIGENSNCNQGCPGMLLVTLGIFYPYSISPFVCFWIFNILLIGVDGKGHKLICWDWLLTCLPCFGF